MTVRQARAGDAAAVCAIWNQVIRDTAITFTSEPKTTAGVAADVAARGPAFLVAVTGGEVAGFATYAGFRKGPGYDRSREHTIILAPGARGQGLGRALMQTLEQVAVRDGVHVLIGGVSGANPDGIAFHARLGFTQTGRLPEVGFKAGRWLDLVLMQKILPGGRLAAPDIAGTAR